MRAMTGAPPPAAVAEAATILNTTGLSYIDNLVRRHCYAPTDGVTGAPPQPLQMLHWPSCETGGGCGPSTDPVCDFNTTTFSDSGCRLSTWKALLQVSAGDSPPDQP